MPDHDPVHYLPKEIGLMGVIWHLFLYLSQSEKPSQIMTPLKLCYLSTYLSTTQFQAQLGMNFRAWLDSAQEISTRPSLLIA